MGKPHAVMMPLPAQGHVIPMMELSFRLIDHGFKVTFINTEFNHKLILDSFDENNNNNKQYPIRMISIPDGLPPEEERTSTTDFKKFILVSFTVMPQKLEEAIRKINADEDDDKVTCLIADKTLGWALEVAEKMGIRRAAFYTASGTVLAQGLVLPKLIWDGIIDDDGVPIKKQIIELGPNIPTTSSENLPWNCVKQSETCKLIFKCTYKNSEVLQGVDWVICNSAFELEPATFTLFPKIIPIGPLLASSKLGRSFGHFIPEDSTCLNWLDQHPARSVIYIAFGSTAVFEQIQFQELALAIELSELRFLWVIRTDNSTIPLPDGFQTRVSNRGKIVSWAPQQSVLGHPSVACFFSHCGWNSTIEGVSHGVPFLCWPYFCDQFLNQDYICDIWETGLRLDKDENGIIPRKEIQEKLNQVFTNEGLKTRALKLMEATRKSLEDGGSSSKNLEDFIKGMK